MTIPASQIVSVTPQVLSGGGAGLDLIGLALTSNTRVPVGQVPSFPSSTAVGAYFGLASAEYQASVNYFLGYNNSPVKPGAMLFAQYNPSSVGAYVRGAPLNLTLAQLNLLSGSLNVTMDGVLRSNASVSLSSATSFTGAATAIATALNSTVTGTATVDASIANFYPQFQGSLSGNVLTVLTAPSTPIFSGVQLIGAGVPPGVTVVSQISGTTGGIGTYYVTPDGQSLGVTAMSQSYGVMNVTTTVSGTVAVGQMVSGGTVAAGTQIVAADGSNNWVVTPGQTVASTNSLSCSFVNTQAVCTGSITEAYFSATGSISGNVMTLTAFTGSPTTLIGAWLNCAGVPPATYVVAQLTGTPNGVGTYVISNGGLSVSSEPIGLGVWQMIVTAVSSGALAIGQTITGTGVPAGTTIVGVYPGATGGAGIYMLSQNAVAIAGPEQFTATATPVACSYDSVSGAFVISSGIVGPGSTVTYCGGTLAPNLNLTSATGAVLSQGAAASTPTTFMPGILQVTTNFASFGPIFEPVQSDKLLFSQWTNSTDGDYLYVQSDSDAQATVPGSTECMGYKIGASGANYSGTALVYNSLADQMMWMGSLASIGFGQTNGRQDFAFMSQSGLTPTVTNGTTAETLIANGYNFYGQYSTANQAFDFMYPGQVSGPFQWIDSYCDDIWLTNQLQLALMTLLTSVGSIPYNRQGYDLILSALTSVIDAALNFGAIRAGVTLSQTQIAIINNAAGVNAAASVASNGWYLQVTDPGSQVRQARGSPIINFWYTDGGDVQMINVTATQVQ